MCVFVSECEVMKTNWLSALFPGLLNALTFHILHSARMKNVPLSGVLSFYLFLPQLWNKSVYCFGLCESKSSLIQNTLKLSHWRSIASISSDWVSIEVINTRDWCHRLNDGIFCMGECKVIRSYRPVHNGLYLFRMVVNLFIIFSNSLYKLLICISKAISKTKENALL